ncbi:MAG: hypothetical protein ACRC8Q_01750, partial [Aeromonas sp.]
MEQLVNGTIGQWGKGVFESRSDGVGEDRHLDVKWRLMAVMLFACRFTIGLFMAIFAHLVQKTAQRRPLAILPKRGFSSIMPTLLFANFY